MGLLSALIPTKQQYNVLEQRKLDLKTSGPLPLSHKVFGEVKLSVAPRQTTLASANSFPTLTDAMSHDLMAKQPEHLQASKDNLQRLATMSLNSTLTTLEKLALRGDNDSSVKHQLSEKIMIAYVTLKTKIEGNGIASKSDIKACKNFSKTTSKMITDVYKKSFGSEYKKMKIADLIKSELQSGYGAQLGKTKELWQPIRNQIDLSSLKGFEKVPADKYQSNMMPAAQLIGLSSGYQASGINGVSSISTQETRHAVNLWTTEFTGSDVKFKGVRHGVNFPFGEKDKTKQKSGADKRTQEVIIAAADVKHDAILAHLKDKGSDTPFTLRIVSSSLLTPASGLKYKEFEMGQQDAWTRAQNNLPTVKITNAEGQIEEVKIKLEVLPFSLGVNGMAKLKTSSPVALKVLDSLPNVDVSGWKWADKHNKPLFKTLESWSVIAKETTSDPAQAVRIDDYLTQIKNVIAKSEHHQDNGNAYALPILVNLLSNELGAVPTWNCMSGKDRTGYLDAKIKETLVLQDQSEKVLDQLAPMDYQRSQLLEKMLFETGSLDIQKACTGVSGYKVNEGVIKLGPLEIDLSVQTNRKNLQPAARPILSGLSAGVKA